VPDTLERRLAKKVRTPAPPRRVQAPQRRVEPKKARQEIAIGDYRNWALVGLAVLLVIGGIIGAVIAAGGGSNKQGGAAQVGPDLVGDMSKLPGIQLGGPPWKQELKHFQARLNVLGIATLPQEALQVHTHSHLDIYANGKHVTVPRYVGFDIRGNKFLGLTPLHTHDTSGVIHKESPSAYDYELGQFFGIWGVRLSKTCIGGLCAKPGAPLRVWVNGRPFFGNPTRILLRAHDEVVIAYGKPPSKIPVKYHFPAGL
jgi:hypothetical protein